MPRPRKKRVDARSRSGNYKQRQHAKGLCVDCPSPVGLNPHTGKMFYRCPVCRARVAAASKAQMKLLRAARLQA